MSKGANIFHSWNFFSLNYACTSGKHLSQISKEVYHSGSCKPHSELLVELKGQDGFQTPTKPSCSQTVFQNVFQRVLCFQQNMYFSNQNSSLEEFSGDKSISASVKVHTSRFTRSAGECSKAALQQKCAGIYLC